MSPSSAVASLSLRGPSSPTAAHAPLGQRLQHLQRVLGAALDELAAALDGCVCFQTGRRLPLLVARRRRGRRGLAWPRGSRWL